jgi:hypothetical protein
VLGGVGAVAGRVGTDESVPAELVATRVKKPAYLLVNMHLNA